MTPVSGIRSAHSFRTIKTESQITKLTSFAAKRSGRPCALALLVGLFTVSLLGASSAWSPSGYKAGAMNGVGSPMHSGSTIDPVSGNIPGIASIVFASSSAGPLAALVVQAPATESVATFADGCVTLDSDFNLGDTVCARVTGAAGRRTLAWVNPFGLIVRNVPITSDPQNDTFILPSAAVETIGDVTGDNRGNWRVILLDASEPLIQSSTRFVVHDPIQIVADLVVYKSVGIGNSNIEVNGDITTTLYVVNRGPDSATNVIATEVVPTDATFVSLTQDSGPTFACTTPSPLGTGTITCTIASLPPGTPGIFTLVYRLTAVTQTSLVEASATSDTTERDTTDNSSTPISPTGGDTGGGGCTAEITCPANITKTADTTQGSESGAIATFTDPSSSCPGTVTCEPLSGSFFAVGTTTVTCTDAAGNSCGFAVTVNAPQDITITVIGANPMSVECHTSFTDPGATATNGAGTSIPVTSQVICCDEADPPVCVPCTVNPNVPGTYTITYTATDGTNTATTTRTVNVVDTTPPTVALSGANPMTVECHTIFTDPGATASDTCAGSFAATASGSVDVNTPGSYTITYDATDSSGNDATPVTRTVNVVDSLPPAVTPPSSVTVNTGAGSTTCGATVSDATLGTGSAIDACDGPVSVTRSGVPSGNFFPVGQTTVTYSATDSHNHTGTATQTVTVVDNTPPTITAPPNATAFSGPGAISCSAVVSDSALGNATASDNCPGVTVARSGAPSGNVFPVGTTTVTYTATDAHGGTATALQTVTVVDNTSPVISCPANITVEPTSPAGAPVTYVAPVGADNCAGSTTTRTAGLASGSTFPIGNTTVTYSVTDAHGNGPVSCSFTVHVKTAAEVIQDLINRVQAIQPPLSGQQTQGLVAKLQAALDAVNQNKTNVACNKLGDFISQVTGYINNGTLTTAQGQPLINSANNARAALGCT